MMRALGPSKEDYRSRTQSMAQTNNLHPVCADLEDLSLWSSQFPYLGILLV